MRFKQFLVEDGESEEKGIALDLRPITSQERKLGKQVQQICRLIHAALEDGKNISAEKVKKLADDLRKHVSVFPFLKRTISFFDEILEANEKMGKASVMVRDNIDNLKSHSAELKKAILSNNRAKGTQHVAELKKLFDLFDHHVNVSSAARRHLENRYTNEPTIFGTTRLLDTLGVEDYELINKLDFSGDLYTFVDFPVTMMEHDFDPLVFFMINLKTEPGVHAFQYHGEFRKFMRVQHDGDPKYQHLRKLVDKYLHSNEKSLIPEILELVNENPHLKKANEKRKRAISTVYRGLGFQSAPSEKEIMKREHSERYVATAESFYSAKNFALQKGHLEPEDSRRAEEGVVLVYEVNFNSVMLDTQVIDTVYNETEIIIDTTKARLKEVKYL